MEQKHLTPADFEQAFNDTFSAELQAKIGSYKFEYAPLTDEERASWMKKIHESLESPWVVRAGEHRLTQWESGWGENLELFKKEKTFDALLPRYFGKYKAVRFRQDLLRPISENFEYHMLATIELWLFEKYLKDLPAIYEFGAGTGHNLFLARQSNPSAALYGMDWATSSQELIKLVEQEGLLANVKASRFDFFEPDQSLDISHDSGIYTIAALEQIGDRFQPFVEYLMQKKPKVCIHVEPMAEFLDATNELDRLSMEYFKKRNYLNGFYDYLKKLESEEKITIHQAQRTNVGSLFIEGYSVVVWSPKT